MDDSGLFRNLEKVFKEHKDKTVLLNNVRRMLFEKEPEYRQIFYLIVPELQNRLENIFDRIIRCYIRPKQKDEYLYDDEVMAALKIKMTPEDVRHYVVFNLGFAEKKKLIYKLFKLSKPSKESIDKLNEIRNAIAHRYDESHLRFVYDKNNILYNYASLFKVLNDCLKAVNEILDIDTSLLDEIDNAEKELG